MCILHAMYAMDGIIYCVPVPDTTCFQSTRTITIQTLDIPQCIQIMARNLPSTVLLNYHTFLQSTIWLSRYCQDIAYHILIRPLHKIDFYRHLMTVSNVGVPIT